MREKAPPYGVSVVADNQIRGKAVVDLLSSFSEGLLYLLNRSHILSSLALTASRFTRSRLSRDLSPSRKLCATRRERRMSREGLAKGLARPATSGEALRRCRVGRTKSRVDFQSARCLIHLVRGSRELSGDQVQWMLDHVRELEVVDPTLAAEMRRLSERGRPRMP